MADFPGATRVSTPFESRGPLVPVPAKTRNVPTLRHFGPIGAPPGAVTHYSMTAICSGDGLRHYWSNTDASFTNAPPCIGGYVGGSLVKLGSWRA